MRSRVKKTKKDSVWRKELIPEDSVWRKELIPKDSVWRKDILAFTGRKGSPCLECPVLMVAEEHKCNHFERIPDDIWEGIELCPVYEEHTGTQ